MKFAYTLMAASMALALAGPTHAAVDAAEAARLGNQLTQVGAEKADWRPYTDGYWAHTNEGWLWNSYEDFGWATYHYGRWTRVNDFGWVWVPGYEWAPAWVAWRGTSPDGGDTSEAPPPPAASSSVQTNYIGWAPLPPESQVEETVGFNAAVDSQYDLTPEYYNFVPVSSFGNPYLAPLILAPLAAYAFWSLTHPYTNIVYVNYRWGRGVYLAPAIAILWKTYRCWTIRLPPCLFERAPRGFFPETSSRTDLNPRDRRAE